MKIKTYILNLIPQVVKNIMGVQTAANKYKLEMNLFIDFIKNISKEKEKNLKSKDIVIYIPPWNFTCVAWFSITIAFFYRKLGHRVRIIFDDVISYDEGDVSFERSCIDDVLRLYVSGFIQVEKLSSFEKINNQEEDFEYISKVARWKTTHEKKSDFRKDFLLENKYKLLLSEALPYIKGLLKKHSCDFCIVPGGVCGNSNLFYYIGKNNGIRVSSYDTGEKILLIGTDNVAAHLYDIEKCILQYQYTSSFNTQLAYKLFEQELSTRISGKDSNHIQLSNLGTEEDYDIVIFLNIDWDTAALGIHKVFPSTYEWINETVNFILNKTDYTVAIRQHPCERFTDSYVFIQRYLAEKFSANKRFKFFSCHDEINSYALLEKAKIILPLSSTIGVEAASMGKCVIVCSNCYYSKLNFVIDTSTQEEYFAQISFHGKTHFMLSEEKIKLAKLTYYFSQCCNWLRTPFTPIPKDFHDWVKDDFENLLRRDDVKILLNSMLHNIPVASLNSDKIMKKYEGNINGEGFLSNDKHPIQ